MTVKQKNLKSTIVFTFITTPCLAAISFPFACSFPVLHFPAVWSNVQRTSLSLPHQHQHFTTLFPQLLFRTLTFLFHFPGLHFKQRSLQGIWQLCIWQLAKKPGTSFSAGVTFLILHHLIGN